MIQCIKDGNVAPASQTFRLNLLDAYENKANIIYKPIITFTNQQTNEFVNLVTSNYTYDKKDRYVELTFLITTFGTPNPLAGLIKLGTDDMPFGFFDVTIRENTINTLPTPESVLGRPIVYTGLMNLASVESGSYANPAVTYNEYTTNDTDTDSVYITN